MKITDHSRGIYRLYPKFNKGKPEDVNMLPVGPANTRISTGYAPESAGIYLQMCPFKKDKYKYKLKHNSWTKLKTAHVGISVTRNMTLEPESGELIRSGFRHNRQKGTHVSDFGWVLLALVCPASHKLTHKRADGFSILQFLGTAWLLCSYYIYALKVLGAMIGENRQLVMSEPVEFEK